MIHRKLLAIAFVITLAATPLGPLGLAVAEGDGNPDNGTPEGKAASVQNFAGNLSSLATGTALGTADAVDYHAGRLVTDDGKTPDAEENVTNLAGNLSTAADDTAAVTVEGMQHAVEDATNAGSPEPLVLGASNASDAASGFATDAAPVATAAVVNLTTVTPPTVGNPATALTALVGNVTRLLSGDLIAALENITTLSKALQQAPTPPTPENQVEGKRLTLEDPRVGGFLGRHGTVTFTTDLPTVDEPANGPSAVVTTATDAGTGAHGDAHPVLFGTAEEARSQNETAYDATAEANATANETYSDGGAAFLTANKTAQTGLGATKGNVPSFVLQYNPAGTSAWYTLGETLCPGATERTCEWSGNHNLNGPYNLRVSYGAARTCDLNQCATAGGAVLFDAIAPAATLEALHANHATSTISLPYSATDANGVDEVELWVSKDGGEYALNATKSDATGSFVYNAPAAGLYRFAAVAVDKAGNRETLAPETSTTVTTTLPILVAEKLYFKNGDARTLTACVNVKEAATAAVSFTFNSETKPGTFVSGCTFRATFGTVTGATTAAESPFQVAATLGDLEGAASATVVESAARLVSLTPALPAKVEVGKTLSLEVTARYVDTGAAAPLVNVAVAAATLEDRSALTNENGKVLFTYTSDGALVEAITLTAATEESTGSPVPVTAAAVERTLVWTTVTGALASVSHESRFSDVGEPFTATYCIAYEDDDAPAVGVEVNLESGEDLFVGTTGSDGCVPMAIVKGEVGPSVWTPTAALSNFTVSFPSTLTVTFTTVTLTLTVDKSIVDKGEAAVFTVTGAYAHNVTRMASGATVEVRDATGAVLKTVTLDATGVGTASHVFAELFDGPVTANLTTTLEAVTTQTAPVGLARVVATEIVLGQITNTDAIVEPTGTITFTVPATWAQNGTAVKNATVTLTPPVGEAAPCTFTSGNATCPVTRNDVFYGRYTVTIANPDHVAAVNRIQGEPVTTAVATWTRVNATASVDDDFVNVGDNITVTYTAIYAHNGSAVPSFTVRIQDTCAGGAYNQVITGTGGTATTKIKHADPCGEAISTTLDQTTDGISVQSPATLNAADPAVWTRVVLTPDANDKFASLGQDVTVSGTLTYAHDGSSVPSGQVNVTKAGGGVLGTFPVVAGAFSGTVSQASVYNGNLGFDLLDDAKGVDVQNEALVGVVWTTVKLAASVSDPLTDVGAPVTVSGTAVYDGAGLGSVATGTVAILKSGNVQLATATITNGVWSASVNSIEVYDDNLTVKLTSATNDVTGADILTPRVTWTRIHLALTAPTDRFVNVTSTLTYQVAATFAHGGAVPSATLKAYADDGTTALGTCTVTDGACTLALGTSGVVYQGKATVKVLSATGGVTAQPATLPQTDTLTWTRLVVSYTHAEGPFSLDEAADFVVSVKYDHSDEVIEGALVKVSGFSLGAQLDFTDATGVATIPGIETVSGLRALNVSAYDFGEDIGDVLVLEGEPELRWTRMVFTAYTYSPAPAAVDSDGVPVWKTGTKVLVTTTVKTEDGGDALPGATVEIRGVQKTANATGVASLSLRSLTPQEVTVRSHGVTATLDGKSITASNDRVQKLRFRDTV